jgi:hypothetical protein
LAVEIRVAAGWAEAGDPAYRRARHRHGQAPDARAKSGFQEDRALGTMQGAPPDIGPSGVVSGPTPRAGGAFSFSGGEVRGTVIILLDLMPLGV